MLSWSDYVLLGMTMAGVGLGCAGLTELGKPRVKELRDRGSMTAEQARRYLRALPVWTGLIIGLLDNAAAVCLAVFGPAPGGLALRLWPDWLPLWMGVSLSMGGGVLAREIVWAAKDGVRQLPGALIARLSFLPGKSSPVSIPELDPGATTAEVDAVPEGYEP